MNVEKLYYHPDIMKLEDIILKVPAPMAILVVLVK